MAEKHADIDVVYVEDVPYLNRDDLVSAIESMPIDGRNVFIYAGLLDFAEKLRAMSLPEALVP